jgi:hypothetical protein
MAVASVHCIGNGAEIESGNILNKFVQENNLEKIKPDLRHFGFNNPNGNLPGMSDHGYERWVSMPENMAVKQPFTKKSFPGGLYAAYMIPMGLFEEWELIWNWAAKNEKYEQIHGDPECMDGLLEEHLNYINMYKMPPDYKAIQVDLLIPIKEKG